MLHNVHMLFRHFKLEKMLNIRNIVSLLYRTWHINGVQIYSYSILVSFITLQTGACDLILESPTNDTTSLVYGKVIVDTIVTSATFCDDTTPLLGLLVTSLPVPPSPPPTVAVTTEYTTTTEVVTTTTEMVTTDQTTTTETPTTTAPSSPYTNLGVKNSWTLVLFLSFIFQLS